MKNKIITIATMLFATAVFCLNSCSDETSAPFNGPDTPVTITAESAGDASATAFSIILTPSDNVVAYTYAIGALSDYALFVSRSSTLKTIKEVNGNNDTTITFTGLTPGTEYAVFAQAYTAEGYRSEVTTITIPTKGARVSVSIEEVNTIYAVVTTEIVGEVSEYITLVASKEMYDEYVALYAAFGLTEIDLIAGNGVSYTINATEGWLLNGNTNYEHIFVVLPFAADGTPLVITKTEFTSPAFVPGLLPPAAGSITVDNITDTSAHIVITPGEGTFGYYAIAVSEFAEATPDDWHYIMYQYLPFYTSPYFKAEDDTWTGFDPGTEYIIAVTPFNANGTDGYGPYYLSAPFKTTGTAPPPPAPAPGPGSVGGKHPAGNGIIMPNRQALQYKKALTKNTLDELNIKRK